MDQWEEMASNGIKWLKLIHESIESFENSRIQYSAYKRLIRKGERGPAPAAQSDHPNSDICGKLCLSVACLKSHLRKCAKSILHPIMSLKSKLIGCANSVAKSVVVWLTWKVTYEHIQFKGGVGGRTEHEIEEVVTLETETTAISVCIYGTYISDEYIYIVDV